MLHLKLGQESSFLALFIPSFSLSTTYCKRSQAIIVFLGKQTFLSTELFQEKIKSEDKVLCSNVCFHTEKQHWETFYLRPDRNGELMSEKSLFALCAAIMSKAAQRCA